MKKYTPFLFTLFLLGCELIVDVEVPFEQQQLVLNSFFNPDSVWSATIHLNRYILSDLPYASIEDATVVVYQNDSPIDTLIHQGNGSYKSKTGKPLIDAEYEIRASTATNEMIRGRSKIPMPAQIKHVEIKNEETPDGQHSIINVTFDDDATEVNYYEVLVQIESERYDPNTGAVYVERRPVQIESNNNIDADNEIFWDGGILFRDVRFNGKERVISVNTAYRVIQDSETVIVTLQTLSEDCFKYKATVQLQLETSGDPFAQPVNVKSNIENGFGIFAGYSQSEFVFRRPRPIITGITPSKGKVGDHVIVSGENLLGGYVSFSSNESQVYSFIVRSTQNEIEVIVPERATTGKIIVYTGSGVFKSYFDFEVIN